MSYQLGIDFGTTFVAAALRRATGGEPEVVPLGGRESAVSSVLHLARDERVTVGEAAAGLAGIDPTRVVRALKRRVGDAEPVVLGGHRWDAEELSARLLRWVVDRVAEREAGPPDRIALAHPPSWAAHTLERLAAALAGQDLGVTFVAEPRAVAHAAAGATAPGETVAVYDLGGGRFDAAVLRREGPPAVGFAMLGVPEAIADLGGLDLDDLVWQHVRAALPDDVAPVARVRRACTRAKEALSAEDEVVVRIRRGEVRGAVHLDRATFEGLIAPQVERTVAALRRTIESAGLEPGQPAALLLVGGSARIPLVARTVTAQLGRVPTVHAATDLVARGAVLALAAPSSAVAPGGLVSTASGYLAVRSVSAPQSPSQGDTEAPTVELAVPAAVDTATTPLGMPAAVVAEAAVHAVTAPDAAAPAGYGPATTPLGTPAAACRNVVDAAVHALAAPAGPGTSAGPMAPAAPPPVRVHAEPIDAPPVPAPPAPGSAPRRGLVRTRAAALLDPGTRRAGRRSLARTLAGVGALVVAALVLVALFRPDGPLDPPIDPVAGDGASQAAVPVPAPPAEASIPTAAEIRTGPAADLRPSVTTTPPVMPRAAPADVPPSAGGVRTAGPRTGMTPPTPVPVV